MKKKTLTIGVAAYNAAKIISNCLDSLLIDEVKNDIEVLVINDGSTDNIQSVVATYENRYPNSIRLINKKNGGHGSTINKTIEEAKGEYLKMVDADDSVEKQGFIALVRHLKKTNADVVMSPYYRVNIVNNHKKLIGYLKSSNKESIVDNKLVNLQDIYQDLLVAMHSLTYRTTLLKENNYKIDEHCFYVDVEYSIYYFLKAKNVLLLNEPVYNYNIGSSDQSVNIDNMRARRAQHLRVAKSMVNFYKKERNKIPSYMKSFFKNNIVNLILVNEYKLLMSLKSSKNSKIELIKFDKYLKKNSIELYEGVTTFNNSKKIKLLKILRKINFNGYTIVHNLCKKSLTTHI